MVGALRPGRLFRVVGGGGTQAVMAALAGGA